jgi:hypothetical protein
MREETAKDPEVLATGRQDFEDMVSLAHSHHVVVRALRVFERMMESAGDAERAQWASRTIDVERTRVQNALSYLHAICERFRAAGCDAIVIKSLDHWPDLGSDLDLYTNADAAVVVDVMKKSFGARLASRSWGDRLANKWNFIVPGLPELVEVHVGRLGQTGEQVAIANSLVERSRTAQIENYVFRVPVVDDRLMICTLQRMYRHFYIRLCDIVDTAALLAVETVDYESFRLFARRVGIWDGVAAFLTVVSDYVEYYRGEGLKLPELVTSAMQLRGEQVSFRNGFLRVPILPHSLSLYAAELKHFLFEGEIRSTARLTLLPCLATAAAIGQRITGDDKGIW